MKLCVYVKIFVCYEAMCLCQNKSTLPKSMQLSIYPLGRRLTFSTSQVYTTQPTSCSDDSITTDMKVTRINNIHDFSFSFIFGICTDGLAECSLLACR